jgi:hypothetical protein
MSKPGPFGLSPYHHFFMEYGQFLGAWMSFEVMIEVALMRLLRLDTREACAVFGSLTAGPKCHILGALLSTSPEGIAKYAIINDAVKCAERNGFAHAFISVNEEGDRFTLVRREIKGSLAVKPKVFSALTMQAHEHIFLGKFEEAMIAFGISEDDLIRHQREVESFAKPPQDPHSIRPRSATSSREAKRESRRQRRVRKIAEHK